MIAERDTIQITSAPDSGPHLICVVSPSLIPSWSTLTGINRQRQGTHSRGRVQNSQQWGTRDRDGPVDFLAV